VRLQYREARGRKKSLSRKSRRLDEKVERGKDWKLLKEEGGGNESAIHAAAKWGE